MKFVEHKLATGAMLTGYLRDETTEMPRAKRTLLPSSFCRPATMCSP